MPGTRPGHGGCLWLGEDAYLQPISSTGNPRHEAGQGLDRAVPRAYSFQEMILATARRAAGSGMFGWYNR